MGQTTDQIEAHIESTREDLSSNFQELEHKVKAATDWKQHFKKHPMTMLGVAFGGGILLASVLSEHKNGRRKSSSRGVEDSELSVASDRQKHKALETWDNIKGALIGLAATRFKEFVGEMVPGFHEQYRETQTKVESK